MEVHIAPVPRLHQRRPGRHLPASRNGGTQLGLQLADTITVSTGDEIGDRIIIPGGASVDRLGEVNTMDITGRVMAHVTYQSGKTGIVTTAL